MTGKTLRRNAIWHPFSLPDQEFPEVKSGDGVWLELADGRRIIDCISSWWVNLHGHAHPAVAAAIAQQASKLEQVIFAGFTHAPAEEFASRLIEHLGEPLEHVFFSDNGSTAVEVALKMAYQYWQHKGQERKVFVGFDGGYHGDTVGAMSIGGASPFWAGFKQLLFPIEVLPYPETYIDDRDADQKEALVLKQLEKLLADSPSQIAAVVIEPLVQGAGGMRMCRSVFLQKLAKICAEANVLLIFDEVMTGFGRTGDWFAFCKAGVTPDLICLSKGITGGFMPMSVTVGSSAIFDQFRSDDTSKMFFHGHSYTANPLACAAACASLTLLESNPEAFTQMGAWHATLSSRYLNHKRLARKRICGTIIACDLESSGSGDYFDNLGPLLRRKFLEKGLLIRPLGNTIYLMPPYCVTLDQLEQVYKTIQQVLDEI